MTEEEKKIHKNFAIQCFNATWDLIDKPNRTASESLEMIMKAHTSLFHWLQIGDPVNFARGHWQLSRCYALAGYGTNALAHGELSMAICAENNIKDFDFAFAYEAIARAYHVLGDPIRRDINRQYALIAAEDIHDPEDRKYLLSEVEKLG